MKIKLLQRNIMKQNEVLKVGVEKEMKSLRGRSND